MSEIIDYNSKYCLDALPYNSVRTPVKWKTFTLREWLNTTFIDAAFTPDEAGKLAFTTVKTEYSHPSNPHWKDPVGLIFYCVLSEMSNRSICSGAVSSSGFSFPDMCLV